MKIMIVDDHPGMRRMIRRIVTDGGTNGTEIIECADGESAVEQFSLHHPDHVLMDVQLKRMSGFEATEKIYECDPNAAVIFITSHNYAAFRTKANVLHAKGFILKDDLSELHQFIHSLPKGEL